MPLTLSNLADHVEHALGGSPSSLLSSTDIVNEAGRHLYSMHEWEFRTRPPVAIDLIANQSYATLPADFGEFVGAPSMTDSLNSGLCMTTIDGIVRRRAGNVESSGYTYFGALVQERRSSRTASVPPARIELYPTPTSTSRGAITVPYLADWVDLEEDEDVAQVPRFAERLLIEVVRAFALGYEDDATGTTSDRLDRIQSGSIFAAAVGRDTRQSSELGPIEGGAVSQSYETVAAGFYPVADPS